MINMGTETNTYWQDFISVVILKNRTRMLQTLAKVKEYLKR